MTRSLPKLLIHATVVVLVLRGRRRRHRLRAPTPTRRRRPSRWPRPSTTRSPRPLPRASAAGSRSTNNLVDAAAVPGRRWNPLLSGAEGRFWVAGDGRARLELQSDGRRRADPARRRPPLGSTTRPRHRLPRRRSPEARERGGAERAAHGRRHPGGAERARPHRRVQRARKPGTVAGQGRVHRARSRRATTAGLSAPPSWRGTPTTASRCAPRSTRSGAARPGARAARRPTSPSARWPAATSPSPTPRGRPAWSTSTPPVRGASPGGHGRRRRHGGVDAVAGEARVPARRRPTRLVGLPRQRGAARSSTDGTHRRARHLRQGPRRARWCSRRRPTGDTRRAAAGDGGPACRRSRSTARPARSSAPRSAPSCSSSATASPTRSIGSVPPAAAEAAARAL